jgi:hypothetical protein
VQPHPHSVRSHRGPPGSGCRNHRLQRGLVSIRGTPSCPAPHVYAQAP